MQRWSIAGNDPRLRAVVGVLDQIDRARPHPILRSEHLRELIDAFIELWIPQASLQLGDLLVVMSSKTIFTSSTFEGSEVICVSCMNCFTR